MRTSVLISALVKKAASLNKVVVIFVPPLTLNVKSVPDFVMPFKKKLSLLSVLFINTKFPDPSTLTNCPLVPLPVIPFNFVGSKL